MLQCQWCCIFLSLWVFLILLAPRVEAVTGTEVVDMHLSTDVQFLTLNYPKEVFCTQSSRVYHTTKLLVQLRIRVIDISMDQSFFAGRELSQDPGTEP